MDPETGATGRPVELFRGPYTPEQARGERRYDGSPDGNRFYLTRDEAARETRDVVVLVLNWFEELKAKPRK